jgi:hypothetical protein
MPAAVRHCRPDFDIIQTLSTENEHRSTCLPQEAAQHCWLFPLYIGSSREIMNYFEEGM